MTSIKTVSLDDRVERRLFEFMNQDRIRHFYTIYDLKYQREKERVWVALLGSSLSGYLLEHERRIVHVRGSRECAPPLLRNQQLDAPLFNIEPHHLSAVKELYEITGPADKVTEGEITTFLIMKAKRETFNPMIDHPVRELKKTDARALADLLETEVSRAERLLANFGFGVFKDGKLISSAVSPDTLDDLATVRGVHTVPEERGKGYASSVCSAVVERLVQKGLDVILYVSKDNPAAIRVYEKIGFVPTGHRFLSFEAKRRREP